MRNDVACGGGRGRDARGGGKGEASGLGRHAATWCALLDPELIPTGPLSLLSLLRPFAALCHPPQDHCLRREVVVAARSAALLQTGQSRSAAGRWRGACRAVRVRGGARGAGCRRCAMVRAGAAGVGGG